MDFKSKVTLRREDDGSITLRLLGPRDEDGARPGVQIDMTPAGARELAAALLAMLTADTRAQRLAEAHASVLAEYADTFSKLAK